MMGVTTASLKSLGKQPSASDTFNSVMNDNSKSTQASNRKVGMGSSKQDLVQELLINFRTVSSETEGVLGHLGVRSFRVV